MNLLFNSDIMNLLLKTNVRQILECFNCRWEVGEVGKVGGGGGGGER